MLPLRDRADHCLAFVLSGWNWRGDRGLNCLARRGRRMRSFALEIAMKDKSFTLDETDISSQRSVSRRSSLGILGLGAGVAAAAVCGVATSAEARSDRGPCQDQSSD